MTKWREINIDQMDAEMRRFAKVRSANTSHPHCGLISAHCPAPVSSRTGFEADVQITAVIVFAFLLSG